MKSVISAKNAYEILKDHYQDFDKLSEDERDFLQGFEDYETFCYYVINGETVIVTSDNLSGDIICNQPLETFCRETVDYIRLEMTT